MTLFHLLTIKGQTLTRHTCSKQIHLLEHFAHLTQPFARLPCQRWKLPTGRSGKTTFLLGNSTSDALSPGALNREFRAPDRGLFKGIPHVVFRFYLRPEGKIRGFQIGISFALTLPDKNTKPTWPLCLGLTHFLQSSLLHLSDPRGFYLRPLEWPGWSSGRYGSSCCRFPGSQGAWAQDVFLHAPLFLLRAPFLRWFKGHFGGTQNWHMPRSCLIWGRN